MGQYHPCDQQRDVAKPKQGIHDGEQDVSQYSSSKRTVPTKSQGKVKEGIACDSQPAVASVETLDASMVTSAAVSSPDMSVQCFQASSWALDHAILGLEALAQVASAM